MGVPSGGGEVPKSVTVFSNDFYRAVPLKEYKRIKSIQRSGKVRKPCGGQAGDGVTMSKISGDQEYGREQSAAVSGSFLSLLSAF